MIYKATIITLSSLLLTGCNLFGQPSQETPQPEPTPTSESVQQIEEAGNQMAAAFQSGKPLHCTVTENGQPNSEYFIKNQQMRMESAPSPEDGMVYYSINDTESMYLWSSDSSQPGMVMNLAEMEQMGDSFDNSYQDFPDISDESVRQEYQESGFEIQCQEESVSDELFTPPADREFVDPTEMFQGMMEGMPTSAPSN